MAAPPPAGASDSNVTPEQRVLALTLAAGAGGMRSLRAALDAFGSPEAVLAAGSSSLIARCGLTQDRAERLASSVTTPAFRIESRLIAEHGVRLVPRDSPEYPAALQGISSAPLLLYVQGTRPLKPPDGGPVLAVVGTRRPTRYGEQATRKLIADLAKREPRLTIVSGLARGIDGIAHEAALESGLTTLAVMAGGLSRVYPPEHADLAARVRGQGALLTEFPMTAPPLPQNFSIRNRIIAGLAKAVLIVEAGEQSGSLITAGLAQAYGRKLLALPANIDQPESLGSNRLIHTGQAQLVQDAADILAALRGIAPHPLAKGPRAPAHKLPRKSPSRRSDGKPNVGGKGQRGDAPPMPHPDGPSGSILQLLRDGPQHPDELAVAAGLSIEQALGLLLELELSGEIVHTAENTFSLP